MDAEPLVRLDVSIDHAEAAGELIDLGCRIQSGQVGEILLQVRSGNLLIRDDRVAGSARRATVDEEDAIEDALVVLRRLLGHPSGSHFGIGGSPLQTKRGYEVKKALKKAVHDHLRPDVRHVTDADGVTVRYAPGPAPIASVVVAPVPAEAT